MNLVDLLGKLSAAMNNPFAIHWTEYSARCLLFFTMGYGIVALTVASSRKNRRRGAEHGSAQWGDVFQIAKRYRDKKHPKENLILTQHFQTKAAPTPFPTPSTAGTAPWSSATRNPRFCGKPEGL